MKKMARYVAMRNTTYYAHACLTDSSRPTMITYPEQDAQLQPEVKESRCGFLGRCWNATPSIESSSKEYTYP
jgi:hypothetical protein